MLLKAKTARVRLNNKRIYIQQYRGSAMEFITNYRNTTHNLEMTLSKGDIPKLAGRYFITWIIFEVIAGFGLPIFMTWLAVFRMNSKSITGIAELIEPRDVYLACAAFLFARIPDFLSLKERKLGGTRGTLAILFLVVGNIAFLGATYAKIDEIMLRGYLMPYVSAWWLAIVVALVSTGLISASMALKAYEERTDPR